MLPPPVSIDTASYKIFVSGKSGVGKTALVAKLAGLEVPVVHHETTGEWDLNPLPILGGPPWGWRQEPGPGPHKPGLIPSSTSYSVALESHFTSLSLHGLLGPKGIIVPTLQGCCVVANRGSGGNMPSIKLCSRQTLRKC